MLVLFFHKAQVARASHFFFMQNTRKEKQDKTKKKKPKSPKRWRLPKLLPKLRPKLPPRKNQVSMAACETFPVRGMPISRCEILGRNSQNGSLPISTRRMLRTGTREAARVVWSKTSR